MPVNYRERPAVEKRQIACRIEQEWFEVLVDEADRQERSIGSMVHIILRAGFKALGLGQPSGKAQQAVGSTGRAGSVR